MIFRLYDNADARRICEAWCRRMQWAIKKQRLGGDGFAFTEGLLAEYIEDAAFTEWARLLPHGSPCVARVFELRELRPRWREGRPDP